MDEWQQTVCAIALFADGYSQFQIAEDLGVSPDRAQELIWAGAKAQRDKEMGFMEQHRAPWIRDPIHGQNYT